MNGQMSEKPKRSGSRAGMAALPTIVLLALAIGAVYWWRSRPTTVQADRITEIQLDTNADGRMDQQYNVLLADVMTSDSTDNILLKFMVVSITPFP